MSNNREDLIYDYLQRKAASDKYKEHFGNIPIGPARGNGEGGSSTSAATWSAGGDSTQNNAPNPQGWTLGSSRGYSTQNDGPDPQGWTLWHR